MSKTMANSAKKALAYLLVFIMVLSLVYLTSTSPGAKADYFNRDYTSLVFDPSLTGSNYRGQYSVTIDGKALVFDSYQVTYVTIPFAAQWTNAANYHKMNIKVPVSYGGIPFEDLSNAPILHYNPWGSDNGAAVLSATTVESNAMKRRALTSGWILVEPGMRGVNTTSGTVGAANYNAYGKLPNPIVDLKASIRYLRYGTNTTLIPGSKELIFAMGSSSGGCAASILGASGNTRMFDAELDAIGAAPGRDDVFAAAPSCPIITRDWADPAAAWMRFPEGIPDKTHSLYDISVAMADAYIDYQASLGLVTTVGGVPKTPLTADNMFDYLVEQLKKSMLDFFNSSRSANYFTSADTGMPGVSAAAKQWIELIYATPGDSTTPVVDIGVIGKPGATAKEFYQAFMNMLDAATKPPYPSLKLTNTDEPIIYPSVGANGQINASAAPASATTRSMGLPTEYGAVFSDFGWDWILAKYGVDPNPAYKDMIRRQRNSVDPLYFIQGDGAADSTVAANWFIRNGGNDYFCVPPIMFNMAVALEMKGKNVDVGIWWAQGHGLTGDVDGFFNWAKALISRTPITYLRISDTSGNLTPAVYTVTRNKLVQFSVVLNDQAAYKGIEWTIVDASYATVSFSAADPRIATVTTKNKVGTVVLTARDTATGISNIIVLRIT